MDRNENRAQSRILENRSGDSLSMSLESSSDRDLCRQGAPTADGTSKQGSEGRASMVLNLGSRLFGLDGELDHIEITILYERTRVIAKVFGSDTYQSLLARLRLIIPSIHPEHAIGLCRAISGQPSKNKYYNDTNHYNNYFQKTLHGKPSSSDPS